jgi:hypothetical protein
VVVILSQKELIYSESEVVPSEYVPDLPERLPPLASHEEAIVLADEFLRSTLGDEFFTNHFSVKEVRSDVLEVNGAFYTLSTWFVIYQYTYNEYTTDLFVAVYSNTVPEGTSRITVDNSLIILEPQEILISEEQAKIIAQENGLDPPYNLILCCELRFHRICWKITREDIENLKTEDLVGLLIDAESGTVLERWVRGRLN